MVAQDEGNSLFFPAPEGGQKEELARQVIMYVASCRAVSRALFLLSGEARLMSTYLIFPSPPFFTFISSSLHLSSLQLLRFLLPFVPSFSSLSPSLYSSFFAPCVLLGHRSIPWLREYSVQRMLGRRSSMIVWQNLQKMSSARTEAPLKTRI